MNLRSRVVGSEAVVRAGDGVAFEDDPDHGRVIVSGSDTGGEYSLMQWTVVSRSFRASDREQDFGPHVHAGIDEVFVVLRGAIDVLIGDRITTLQVDDTLRVAAGTRHGYRNCSGHDAEMLVMFCPGGFEELFVKYRSDQSAPRGDGFVADARRLFATEFEA